MPLRLSSDRVSEAGLVGTIPGFGQTNVEPRTPIMQFIESSTMSTPDCRRHFSRNQNPFNAVRIFESNICFINPVGRGACGADSGGSVQIENVSVGFVM